MAMEIGAFFAEIVRLAETRGGKTDEEALDRIRTLIELLRDDPLANAHVTEKLLDAMNWFEVLFSNRHQGYAPAGGMDGTVIVRAFAIADLTIAQREMERQSDLTR